jgi:hypothetical protein
MMYGYQRFGGKCCLDIQGMDEIDYNTGRYMKDSQNGSYKPLSSLPYISDFFSGVACSSTLGM